MEKELDEIRDWVTVDVYHDIYSMETHLKFWKAISLRELVHKFGENEKDLQEIKDPSLKKHEYGIDNSKHIDIGNELVSHILLNGIYIIDFQEFIAAGEGSYMWGYSNHKYGLLDSNTEAAD